VKFTEIAWNFEELVLFQNLVDTHQAVAHQPGLPLRGRATVWWCSITFFPFQSLFKLPKVSLKIMFTTALSSNHEEMPTGLISSYPHLYNSGTVYCRNYLGRPEAGSALNGNKTIT